MSFNNGDGRALRIGLFRGLLFAAGWIACLASAQSYPTKPLRLVVSFAAGGAADIISRVIAEQLTERLGQQVIVDNRVGAGGVIGSTVASKARPDGYTLLNVGSAFAISPSLHDLPFDPIRDFAPVAKLGTAPYVLAVHAGLPANSVKDLIALAKKKPGSVSFGAAGSGSFIHLATELFRISAGIEILIVQYKGGGLVTGDLLGGHTQAYIGGLTQLIPHIRSGKVKALGNTGTTRSAVLPDVPTISEAGVPGYDASNWWGFLVPAGTPKPVIDRLNKDLTFILDSDRTKKFFVGEGGNVSYLGPAEFGLFVASEIKKWAKVVKDGKIQR